MKFAYGRFLREYIRDHKVEDKSSECTAVLLVALLLLLLEVLSPLLVPQDIGSLSRSGERHLVYSSLSP